MVEWTARQLLDLKPAIGLLDIWVHCKGHMETTHETLQELQQLAVLRVGVVLFSEIGRF